MVGAALLALKPLRRHDHITMYVLHWIAYAHVWVDVRTAWTCPWEFVGANRSRCLHWMRLQTNSVTYPEITGDNMQQTGPRTRHRFPVLTLTRAIPPLAPG